MVRTKLDFGCGGGLPLELTPDRTRYHNWLVENSGEGVYGIDIDPRKVSDMQGLTLPDTQVIMADGHATPFDDKFFDVIHIGAALHHMMNYHLAIKEVARISKPGCELYVLESVDNDTIFRVIRRLYGKFRGDDVESYFKSDRLVREIKKYFIIKDVRLYWRFYLSDALLNFNKEPQISLRFNNWVNSKIVNKYRWASHVVIEAERKQDA